MFPRTIIVSTNFPFSVDTITKQEIQTVEGKLIKYFSKQLDIKAKFGKEIDLGNYPSLSKWLVVVGITKESARVIENSMNTLEDLKAKTDADLERYIKQVFFKNYLHCFVYCSFCNVLIFHMWSIFSSEMFEFLLESDSIFKIHPDVLFLSFVAQIAPGLPQFLHYR